jgi:hypothetical protein
MMDDETPKQPKRRGRPPKSERKRLTLVDVHSKILEVAERKTRLNLSKTESITTTYLEANTLTMATGNPKNRLASMNFIELVTRAASFLDNSSEHRK